jgi:hypothetical protein
MMSRNTEDRGSIKNSKGIFRLPELIHENKLTICDFSDDDCSSKNTARERTKEHSTLREAIVPLNPLLIFFPKKPLIKNPNNGNRGISAANLIIIML